MTGTELALIITAGTGLFVAISAAIGKTASYLIGLIQTQAKDTIIAKNDELAKERSDSKAKDERIALLEGKLRKAGIDP